MIKITKLSSMIKITKLFEVTAQEVPWCKVVGCEIRTKQLFSSKSKIPFLQKKGTLVPCRAEVV